MTVLPILTYPNLLLEMKANKIADPKSPEIQEIILDMLETMENSQQAVGLAAPQIGKSISLCTIKFEGKTYILINPKIKSRSWGKEIGEEGCLSFPGKYIQVKRNKKIKVVALNKNGDKIILKAEGFLARVLQHEIDHLDGTLFIEKEIKKNKKITKNK